MNDSQLFGFWLAVAASVPFAAYILPRKLSRLPVLEYQCWLGLAVAPIMIIATIIAHEGMFVSVPAVLLAVSCGPLWAFGSIFYAQAVDHIGVARSTPIKNLAPMWASIYGILLFREYTMAEPTPLIAAIGGTIMMILAAQLLGKAGAPSTERAFAYDINRSATERKNAYRKGWLYSFFTAAFYGAYSVPLKMSLKGGMGAIAACAWLGIGVLITSTFAYQIVSKSLWPKRPENRELKLALGAGAIWTTAQVLGTIAMLHVAMSVSWPISNLSTLIAIGWGVWVFKEVRLADHKREVWTSLIVYSIGLGLLALAAREGHV